MAASQKGFRSYKLSIHKKTNIMQIMTKNIKICIYLIFYQREIVKLGHFMTLSLSYANTVLWCSRCKIHRFVAEPLDSASIYNVVFSLWTRWYQYLLHAAYGGEGLADGLRGPEVPEGGGAHHSAQHPAQYVNKLTCNEQNWPWSLLRNTVCCCKRPFCLI